MHLSRGVFPEIVYGPCPLCGGAEESSPTDADAEVRDTSIRSMRLRWYEPLDMYMCDICIHIQESDETSIKDADGHLEEERFRRQAGFARDPNESGTTIT